MNALVGSPATASRLRITEIFRSLQGEADTAGWPTVFIRLTGCPLRCAYCDSAYAFGGGEWMELDAILEQVVSHATPRVCVTGGEPLAQRNCLELLSRLCDVGLRVSLETSGAMALAEVDPRVVKVVDVKTPASGEEARNRYADLRTLGTRDIVKFVIVDRADYEWSRDCLGRLALPSGVDVYFSPSHEQLPAGLLADWLLADALPVRLQLQMHKYLWGNVPGR
jgi:7-carboxy-7-deazaguanine synthase